MMLPAWLRARSELRRRRASWLTLALLFGLVGGAALTAAVGARRTSTAFERLLVQSKAHDVEVQIVEEAPETILQDVAALPQVSASGRVALFPADDQPAGGDPEPFRWEVSAAAIMGDGLTEDLDLPRVVAGRAMSFAEPHEAMASESFVRQRGIGVGDRFTIQTATMPEVFELFSGRTPIPTGPEVTVDIVGVWKLPHDVSLAAEEGGLLYLSPAFARRYGEQAATFQGLMVRLHNGASDLDAFVDGARSLSENPDALSFTPQQEFVDDVGRAVDVMALGLWVVAGVIAAVALLVIGQAAARAMALGAEDLPTLRALGFGGAQLAAAALIPVLVMTLVGAGSSIVIALLASPLTPLGFVREIEPSPGFRFDPLVILVGALALAVAMVARSAIPAIMLARRAAESSARAGSSRRSRSVELVARAGLPASAVAGVRFALHRGAGSSSLPVRTTLGGLVAAVVAVVAALPFGQSIDRLVSTPASYGWNWDLVVFGGEDPARIEQQVARLADHPLVADAAAVSSRASRLGDEELTIFGFRQIVGHIEATVLEGRIPSGPDEIALGSDPMRRRGLGIGDTVELPAADCARADPGCIARFTVVGRVVPVLEGIALGEGAVSTADGLARVRATTGFTDYPVRLREGVSVTAARARFEREFGDAAEPRLPAELLNLDRVSALPDVVAVLLVVVASAVMGHALVTAVRRRRRDLAILKSIGFGARQVRAAVAWQGTTVVLLALVLGIPVGLGLGRWAWRLTAERIGVAADPVAPVLTLVVGAVGLLAIANLVALLPGRAAARTQPATVLRAE